MMLRNRNLNVQGRQQQENGKKKQPQQGAVVIKRKAASFLKDGNFIKEIKDEPRPKRAYKEGILPVSSSILPDLSTVLCIDSADKNTNDEFKIPEENSWTTKKQQTTTIVHAVKQEELSLLGNKKKIVKPEEEMQMTFQFDREQKKDLTAVSDYVQDIFFYHKYREQFFRVTDYTQRKPTITIAMRAEIVNWLVDLQETCELNHETLYLAVKLFDLFMDRVKRIVPSGQFQLVAATAVLISAKFDYYHFDLGAPLSYRFLRRFARVSKTDMITLTLARYILELSLMSLRFCRQSDSLIAAACLILARQMRHLKDVWNPIVEKCCGYTQAEIQPLMNALNRMLIQRRTQHGKLDTIYRKYSHEIFFNVSAINPLPPLQDLRVNKHNANKPAASSSCDILSD